MDPTLICLIVALVLFVIGAIGVDTGRLNVTNAGLAFLVLSMIV